MSEPKFSQVSCVGFPPPKSWDDYDEGCQLTYSGGHHEKEARDAFKHGMGTVFNLLRAEFPPAEMCKAAPALYAACQALVKQIRDYQYDPDAVLFLPDPQTVANAEHALALANPQ
jgi:hypothetical protein